MLLALFLLSMVVLSITWTIGETRVGQDPKAEGWGTPWLEGITRFFLLWIGSNWLLAAINWFRPAGLMSASALMGTLAFRLALRNPDRLGNAVAIAWKQLRAFRLDWLFIGALGLLVSFNLFKGWILPCANTDALAWSMPISIRYHLNHGLDWASPAQDEWMNQLIQPHNYELLISSILSLTGRDRITEWFSTLSGIGVLSVVGVQFRRWSGPGLHNWTTLLVFCAAPVFLLHLSADKADLFTTLLILLAIFWTVRAWLEESPRSTFFAIWVLFALFNVKKSGWMLVPPLLLSVYLRLVLQTFRNKAQLGPTIARILGHSLLACLAMGGIKMVWLWFRNGTILHGQSLFSTHSWLDPFNFLWVVSLAPFRSSDYSVRLLSGQEWYWPEYNLIYSHYGWMFGPLLLTALVVLVGRLFEKGPTRLFPREQWLCLGISTLLFYLLLFRNYSYDGGYNTFPRIVLFYLPPLLASGLMPLLRRARHPLAFGVVALTFLSGAALSAYRHDMVAPFVYLEDLWRNPWKRRWVFVGPNRMPWVFDRVAEPKAVVAVDNTYLTWLAPLWGEGFTRDVRLIHWQEGRPHIPKDATWVVIDNVSGQSWGNGYEVRNAEDFGKAFRRGVPSKRDVLLFPILKADPNWELLTASPLGEQAIFRRRLQQ